jgi:hypothetical protein
MSWPAGAPKWSDAQLSSDISHATRVFREKRDSEGRIPYEAEYDKILPVARTVVSELGKIFANPSDGNRLAQIFESKLGKFLFRYLGGPPISEDDLKTMAEIKSIAPSVVRDDPETAEAVVETVRAILDRKRFSWVEEGRSASKQELDFAVRSTTILLAAKRVETQRRSGEMNEVQTSVDKALKHANFSIVSQKSANAIDFALPGKYAAGCTFGQHAADFLVRLRDKRTLAIECKGSNSTINSRKRINKEILQDAAHWYSEFGRARLIVAGVIQGVYDYEYLRQAQSANVVFFWNHRLSDLEQFLINSH